MIALIAAFGIVFFFKETDLTSRLRTSLISLHPIFYRLLDCYFCLGFWVSAVMFPLIHFHSYDPIDHFLFAFAGAAVSFTLSSIINSIQTKKEHNVE